MTITTLETFNADFQGSVKPGILIVITGEQPRSIVLGSVVDTVRESNIQVIIALCSSSSQSYLI